MNILIIQTAFLGDVILATALVESIHKNNAAYTIDVLVRKGNDCVFDGHPFVRKVIVWDKTSESVFRIIRQVRKQRYDAVINIQRHFRTGLITALSGSSLTVGFNKNPLSFLFSKTVAHVIDGRHEIIRNQGLAEHFCGPEPSMPRLYPSSTDYSSVSQYQHEPYVCIAPTSVWATKQYPSQGWVEVIKRLDVPVWLLGAPADAAACDAIVEASGKETVRSLAGKLSVLQSAAIMSKAVMNFVNDSAAMHIASSVNAPTTALFCSTIPAFGFGPLSKHSVVVETQEILTCRPCGLHGRPSCPEGHFKCATTITPELILRFMDH